jgi:hypothetical protein
VCSAPTATPASPIWRSVRRLPTAPNAASSARHRRQRSGAHVDDAAAEHERARLARVPHRHRRDDAQRQHQVHVATILSLRNSANAAVLEPELFDNGANLNSTQTAHGGAPHRHCPARQPQPDGGGGGRRRRRAASSLSSARSTRAQSMPPTSLSALWSSWRTTLCRRARSRRAAAPWCASTPLVRRGRSARLRSASSDADGGVRRRRGRRRGRAGRLRSFLRSMTEQKIFILDDTAQERHQCDSRDRLAPVAPNRCAHDSVGRLDERHDEVEFTLFVDNHGPSDSAGVTVELAFNMPHNVALTTTRATAPANCCRSSACSSASTANNCCPRATFTSGWPASSTWASENDSNSFSRPTHRREGGSPLQLGAAVVRRLTQEKNLLNDDDASLLVFQQL